MKPTIVVILCTLLSAVIANAQKIEAESSASETVIHAVNSNSVSTSSRGVYGEGYHGLEGMAKGVNGIGVKGTSTTSTGIFGTSTSGRGVWGDSESSFGVFGGSDGSIAVYGISNVSAGVLGQSTSGSGTAGTSNNSYGLHGVSQNFHGAFVRGRESGGFADLVLGGTDYWNGNDDGVIMSDPSMSNSDLFLVAQDAVVVQLDNDTNSTGNFEVWNDINEEVLVVAENGQFEVWDGTSPNERILLLQSDGDLFIDGNLTQGSDRNRKENFASVDLARVLESISEVSVYTWNYLGDKTPHMGPMAQDFYRVFGLGETDTGIGSVDIHGVLLASVQALKQENVALREKIDYLMEKFEELERNHR